ncbi:MAG: hypothetical protein JO117_07930, partial [Verrucomicrobia bacterium]|nr:hypothetical protein [Verrucomicrobiota bacterium]MBV9656595.1 hypothetical protein [Verrucomicrobiota bacterium]
MLLDRSQRSWFVFTLLASAVILALYALVFHPEWMPAKARVPLPAWLTDRAPRLHGSVGNSPLGLTYGIIAYAIFIFAVLLNVRKKFPLMRFGRAQSWLRAHIWLTILTLPLVYCHAAFHFGGLMTSSLMWLYLVVMFSGFYGLALQQFMPRMIMRNLTLETVFEQIPYLTQQIQASAIKMRDELRTPPAAAATGAAQAKAAASAKAAGASPAAAAAAVMVVAGTAEGEAPPDAPPPIDPSAAALLEALRDEVLPYLSSRSARGQRLANARLANEYFRGLRLGVAGPFQEKAEQLASWCEERRQMDLQTKYHHWLHGWLLLHVPASLLLLIMTGWHAVVLLFLY